MLVPRVFLAAIGAVMAASAFSCAASNTYSGGHGGQATTSATGTTASGMGGTSTGTGGQGTGGDLIIDSGIGDAPIDPDASCGLITKQATSTPLDLYIAFDKSSTMAGFKWDAAKAGLTAFLNDAASAGIKVAINFFPLDNNPTCDQHAYEPPMVAFGVLPGNAQPVIDAMNTTQPNGFSTPIYPALGGAILGAKAQADTSPGDSAAVLLVTDGAPQGPSTSCGGVNPEDPAAIAQLATAGLGLGVKTFVIGLPGVDQTIANKIAAAGGTSTAIVVSTTDVQGEFAKALAKVRGEALPCSFEVPSEVSGGQVDYQHVNVLITPGGGSPAILAQDPSCAGAGWKYDDPANPKAIVFCPQTCTAIRADLTAKAQIMLGCQTVVN
jgi:hypothetical protein